MLYLTLFRKWFDQILYGEKREEYREATAYWRKRLEGRLYREIIFHNGYARNARWMRVECISIHRATMDGREFYILKLGAILETGNL